MTAMGRLLFLLLLAAIVFWMFRSWARARRTELRQRETPLPPAEDMVRCAVCGVHLPRSESVMREGQLFCGEEHSRLPS